MKPRILLSAYQCGPGMGSVSQIGWEWYRRLAPRAEVTLVTHVRNRAALESAGAPLPGTQIHYIDTEWFAGPLYRLGSRLFPKSQHAAFMTSSLDYFVFDNAAWRHLSPMRGNWDIVHVVTPVSPQAYSLLHRLDLPVIRGPLNGGLGTPAQFREILHEDQTWLYPLRELGRVADLVRRSSARTSLFLTSNLHTRKALPRAARLRCRTMLENGVDLDLFRPAPYPAAPSGAEPLRLLTVGRLVPCKALPLLLRAIGKVRSEFPVVLEVVGSGPMRAAWEQTTRQLGLSGCVTFRGEQTPAKVAAQMQRCHLFCLPSVRESGGAVLLEAMSCARPVAAVGYGGPSEIVHDAVGRIIPADGPDVAVEGFAGVMRDVVSQPWVWKQKGLEGRREAERLYSWDTKVEQVCQLYKELQPALKTSESARLNFSTSRS